MARSKLRTLCQCLQPETHLKQFTIFREGDVVDFVFFVVRGEVKLTKKIYEPVLRSETESTQNMFESTGQKHMEPINKIVHHTLAVVGTGAICGADETILNRGFHYTMSAVVSSVSCEVYKMDKETFFKVF